MQRERETPGPGLIRIPRSFWYSAAFVTAYTLVFGSWVLINESPSPAFQAMQHSGAILGIIISFALSWIGIKRYRRKQEGSSSPLLFHIRLRLWVPLLLSSALFFQSLGNILYAYYSAHNTLTFPSWADAAILAFYPPLIIGTWFLPTHTVSKQIRLRVMLDSLIILVAMVTFSWYFVLGPTFLHAAGAPPLVILAHGASPIFDLLLISSLIFFTVYVPGGPLRIAVSLLSVGLVFFVLADVLYQYGALQNHFLLGWYSLGWPIGNLLIGLSAQAMRWQPDQRIGEESKRTSMTIPLWRSLLPYVFVPIALGLVLYVWSIDKTSTSLLTLGTYSCGLLLLALIFIRQILAIQETYLLNRSLHTANARLEALTTTDPLTELPNHRALLATLTNEVERTQRYQRACTLLFLDLDHFKALNDGYGHGAGDDVLIDFGRRLRQSVRGIDTVGRWGGEEFLAILPETTISEAQAIAERIRGEVSQRPFAIGGGIYLTCSIGIALSPTHATTLDALIDAADQAMYAAKRLGRNQHRVIDDPAVQLVIAGEHSEGGREETALNGFVMTLISLLKRRDAVLGDHSNAVADLVEQMAIRLGIPSHEAHMIHLAGQLHDLGKIGIPDAILQKPAALTADEWLRIKQHPAASAEIVSNIPALRPLIPAIRGHHEWWDGTGYPDQLRKEDIPLAARMLAVANAYIAMIEDRPYRKARSSVQACGELHRCSGTQFDPSLVEVLTTLLDEQTNRQQAAIFSA